MTGMNETAMPEELHSGPVNLPTAIDLLETLLPSAREDASSLVNFVSSPARPSLIDESVSFDPSNTSIRGESTLPTRGRANEVTDSISSTFIPSRQQELIILQSRGFSSQSVSSTSVSESSITLLPKTTSMSSSELTSINSNLPLYRPPPLKKRSSNALKRSNDMDSDLSKENREEHDEHVVDRSLNNEHYVAPPINGEQPFDLSGSSQHVLDQPINSEHTLDLSGHGQHVLDRPTNSEHPLDRSSHGQHLPDRPTNSEHLLDRSGRGQHLLHRSENSDHLQDRQPSATRKSNRSRKRPARFDSPDSDAALESLENGGAKKTHWSMGHFLFVYYMLLSDCSLGYFVLSI